MDVTTNRIPGRSMLRDGSLMRILTTTLVALTLALAGCVGAPSEAATTAAAPADAPAAPGTPFTASGSSSFQMTGSCVPVCVYAYTEDIGSFKAPAPLQEVVVEAHWTPFNPLNEELIVSLVKRGKEVASATGTSPLVLDVGALEPGTYEVRLFYTTPGHHSETIEWSVTGAIA